MTQSFNCLILNTSTIISIPIFNEADKVNKMFIMYQGQKLHVSSFSVAILIEYICKKTNINYPDMKLWKINKKKEEIENKNVLTGEDIEKELNGKEMELQKLFKTYFINELNQANSQDDEDDEDDETAENIHIIAISTTGKCLLMFYFSNKKFAITNIILISFLIVFRYCCNSRYFCHQEITRLFHFPY